MSTTPLYECLRLMERAALAIEDGHEVLSLLALDPDPAVAGVVAEAVRTLDTLDEVLTRAIIAHKVPDAPRLRAWAALPARTTPAAAPEAFGDQLKLFRVAMK